MHADIRTVDLADRDRELRAAALGRIRRRRNFLTHVYATVVGALFVAVVWATTEYHNAGGWPTGFATGRRNHDWDPWIIYPLMASALALAVHAWVAFGRRPASERDIAREVARLHAEGFPYR